MADDTTGYEAPQIVDYGSIADHTYFTEGLPQLSGRSTAP